MPVDTLDTRTLNRTVLSRQHLLERTASDAITVMRDMGGIQMQYAPAGYIGLWSRVRGFERPMLTRALEECVAVQGTMMRATIHTVASADYWPAMAGMGRVNREWSVRVQARDIGSTDIEAVAGAIRTELRHGPLRVADLTQRLVAKGFPPRALVWASTWVEIVRIPPSGTWERRRADLYGLAEWWLGPAPEITEDAGIEHLIRRYLGAFGPAALKDIANWMGFNVGQMRHVAERMNLRPYRDQDGRTLVDLSGAEIIDGAASAPPRFLPVWDAMLLVHARRTQVLPEAYRPRIFNTKTPHSHNTFLIDGQVAGTWRFQEGEIQLSPFQALAPADRMALEDEAHQLTCFHR